MKNRLFPSTPEISLPENRFAEAEKKARGHTEKEPTLADDAKAGREEAKISLQKEKDRSPKERLRRALDEMPQYEAIDEALGRALQDAADDDEMIAFVVSLQKKAKDGTLDLQKEWEALQKEEEYARKQETEHFIDALGLLGQKISVVGELLTLMKGEKKKETFQQ